MRPECAGRHPKSGIGKVAEVRKQARMLNNAPDSIEAKNWKEIYVAALLEGDPGRVPHLILEAECAILERARALFLAPGGSVNVKATASADPEEEEALNEALYALHALKSCLAVHGRFAEPPGQADPASQVADAKNND